MRSPPGRAALLALALLLPSGARAHGVELDVERGAAGIAVRARYEGGRPLADAVYEVVSPAAPGRAHDEGRTDRHGWLVFVPDAPGAWTVRIVDAGGHGKVARIDVPAGAAPAAAERPVDPAAAATPPAPPAPPLRAAEAHARAGSIYRVVGGLAAIAMVFVVLFAVLLRRKSPGR